MVNGRGEKKHATLIVKPEINGIPIRAIVRYDGFRYSLSWEKNVRPHLSTGDRGDKGYSCRSGSRSVRAHVADKEHGEKSGVGETSSALARVRGLLLRTIDRNLRTISSAACSFGTTAGSGTFTSTFLAAPAPVFFRMDMGVVVGTRAAARVSAETPGLY